MQLAHSAFQQASSANQQRGQASVAAARQQQQQVFSAALRAEHTTFLDAALAKSSKGKVVTAMRNYAAFCDLLGYEPHLQQGGISNPELELYITWMARTLKPQTISQYLSSGIRHLSEAAGIRWVPPSQRYSTDLLMRGVKRLKGTAQVNRKHAVTLPLLRQMATLLDLDNDPNDQIVWTVCVLLFFTFLRKGHAMVNSRKEEGPSVILREDLKVISSDRFVLTVKHTKTIQFQQRTLRYLMTRLDPGDVCCPTTQLAIYMCATPGLQPDEPLFQAREVHEPTGTVFYRPLRYDTFLAKFKSLIRALGLDPDAYAGHSFRRGGATFARDAGLGDADHGNGRLEVRRLVGLHKRHAKTASPSGRPPRPSGATRRNGATAAGFGRITSSPTHRTLSAPQALTLFAVTRPKRSEIFTDLP